jgi:hypothetical protein
VSLDVGQTKLTFKQYFGLPSNLLNLVIDAANLVAQADQLSALIRLPPSIMQHADDTMRSLYDWRPDVTVYQEDQVRLDLTLGPEIACEQEFWRVVTILQLKKHVYRLPITEETTVELITDAVDLLTALLPLAVTRRAASNSVVDMWTAFNCQVSRLEQSYAHSDHSKPAFLLGTFLADAGDRNLVRRFIEEWYVSSYRTYISDPLS